MNSSIIKMMANGVTILNYIKMKQIVKNAKICGDMREIEKNTLSPKTQKPRKIPHFTA